LTEEGEKMELLEQRIRKDGRVVGTNILKVDNFLNHQLDTYLFEEMGKEFARLFKNKKVDKILTIEASGIAIASVVARFFNYCPVVFAKKTESLNLSSEIYSSEVYSFTKQRSYKIMVSKKFINENENILIIDDFLANGKAAQGLIDLIHQAGATLAGIGIAVEKGFQDGGKMLRDEGIQVESLAIVEKMSEKENTIVFRSRSMNE